MILLLTVMWLKYQLSSSLRKSGCFVLRYMRRCFNSVRSASNLAAPSVNVKLSPVPLNLKLQKQCANLSPLQSAILPYTKMAWILQFSFIGGLGLKQDFRQGKIVELIGIKNCNPSWTKTKEGARCCVQKGMLFQPICNSLAK